MSIFTMGIDVGSTASKCIILKDGKEIVAKSVISVGTGTSGPARAMKEALDQIGLPSFNIIHLDAVEPTSIPIVNILIYLSFP